MRKWMRSLLAGLAGVAIFPALALGAKDTLTIPAGSTLHVRLTTTLSTRTNQNGDPWTGQVLEPIIANSEEAVPAGSTVEGRVTFVKEPGKVKGVGEMRLVAETITTLEGTQWSIAAGLEDAQGADGAKVSGEEGTIKGPSSKKGDAIGVGVGAGVGAAAGGIAMGGKGALYGAGIGAAATLIRGLFKRGKDIILPQGTELTFVISRTTNAKKIAQPADTPTQ
jgi:type IV secretion system protein VirB10